VKNQKAAQPARNTVSTDRLILPRQYKHQNLAVFPADLPRRIAPLAQAIQHGQAIREGRCHGVCHEARPFRIGHRRAGFHIPPEIGFRDGGWACTHGAGLRRSSAACQ
jgi:hypothetical protein